MCTTASVMKCTAAAAVPATTNLSFPFPSLCVEISITQPLQLLGDFLLAGQFGLPFQRFNNVVEVQLPEVWYCVLIEKPLVPSFTSS